MKWRMRYAAPAALGALWLCGAWGASTAAWAAKNEPEPVGPPAGGGFETTIFSSQEETPAPTVLPVPGGEILLPTAKDKRLLYDTYGYAPVRRAGDFVFLAGVVAGPLPGEARDAKAFADQLRRAFRTIQRNLEAAGASMADVVELETYHLVKTPNFEGDLMQQFNVFFEVKPEFFPKDFPTWTVLGVSALADANAVVEIKVTAYAPKKKKGLFAR